MINQEVVRRRVGAPVSARTGLGDNRHDHHPKPADDDPEPGPPVHYHGRFTVIAAAT